MTFGAVHPSLVGLSLLATPAADSDGLLNISLAHSVAGYPLPVGCNPRSIAYGNCVAHSTLYCIPWLFLFQGCIEYNALVSIHVTALINACYWRGCAVFWALLFPISAVLDGFESAASRHTKLDRDTCNHICTLLELCHRNCKHACTSTVLCIDVSDQKPMVAGWTDVLAFASHIPY